MGAVKKFRKITRDTALLGRISRLEEVLNVTRKKEGMLLRALFEFTLPGTFVGAPYAASVLKQMYGSKILDQLAAEITKADKKSKGLDKIVLTGTEAME